MVTILRPEQRVYHIPGAVTVRAALASAAAANWWDSITDPVLVYCPKGAASYAASKVNLANPGTYNAIDGPTYPSFDTTRGWIFDSTEYLTTGLAWGASTWTAYIRLANCTKIYGLMGDYASPSFMVMSQPGVMEGYARFGNGGGFAEKSSVKQGAAHVFTMTAQYIYLNGALKYSNIPTGAPSATTIRIGASWEASVSDVVAIVICSSQHSDAQIAANYTVMAAL